ncbi:MAG: bifunctional DNA-formamidopyrimidine glycosylase/DNA-(apurinic or apyrimidinic site) lyase [Actinomycetales bacterium]|nr:bifunctional DNA-formamidopyrimidine glycosylase/DNA-(apurinic or apyrimidinic site) lyase [Actinomycetales bacterium]
MPELPEVEVVRRGIDAWATNRTISRVDVLHARSIRRCEGGTAELRAALEGDSFRCASRRGKYLWLPLTRTNDQALVVHLGMSGQVLMQPQSEADETHLRVRVRFADDDREMRFVDQRTFGGMHVDEVIDGVPSSITHIARDPLDPDFDEAAAVRAIRHKDSEVKRVLLDQSVVSGIGNIYADEALWRSSINGRRRGSALTSAQIRTVVLNAREVMLEALAQGGTSFDSLYVNVNGESGYFERALDAYGREGEPCRRCGAAVRREAFMNRSSYRCPRCQRAPRGGAGTG